MKETLLRFTGSRTEDPAIATWFASKPAAYRTIAEQWFSVMRHQGSDVRELFHDGCPVVCVDDAPFSYVNAFTAHVSVGFFHGSSLPDPAGILTGAGKHMRHVKIKPGMFVDEHALETLVREAYRDIGVRARENG